jgi:hypothetical protein
MKNEKKEFVIDIEIELCNIFFSFILYEKLALINAFSRMFLRGKYKLVKGPICPFSLKTGASKKTNSENLI